MALGVMLVFTCYAQTKSQAPPKQRPNIIFILVNELRYNALSCMGHPFVKTPNIGHLAK